ncbi:hypothetical protein OG894_04465 [Streptomyces sp. NBC_01724]|uniref:hypothetical protein n=1 Tax=unclassified Streptomyces TaxID=2593676 RepID=UPI002E3515E5|nr:hypothetical protein [Streptomyces sp. NBC_01724]WTI91415.1 hypothetical protein OHB17_37315 [Streptomyces sp. NBC_00724]
MKWKDGGTRSDRWQSERFDDEDSAGVFKDAVDEAGQHWPPGWVKGKGYIDPTAADELRYPSIGGRLSPSGTAPRAALQGAVHPGAGDVHVPYLR